MKTMTPIAYTLATFDNPHDARGFMRVIESCTATGGAKTTTILPEGGNKFHVQTISTTSPSVVKSLEAAYRAGLSTGFERCYDLTKLQHKLLSEQITDDLRSLLTVRNGDNDLVNDVCNIVKDRFSNKTNHVV